MNATDPNGFVVVEFKPFDNQRERAKPYPYEVTSHEAVDYKYENNVLQYLTVKTSFLFRSIKRKTRWAIITRSTFRTKP